MEGLKLTWRHGVYLERQVDLGCMIRELRSQNNLQRVRVVLVLSRFV